MTKYPRFRGARGATLVETALVAPIILLIVFGIIQTSFVFRTASITTTATRAGARVAAPTYGEAAPADQTAARQLVVDAAESSLDDLRDHATPSRLLIYRATAAGLPQSGSIDTCGVDCVEYQWNAATSQFDYLSGAWADPDNCGQVLDRLGVSIEVTHDAAIPILPATFDVEERTIMRLEPGQFSLCTTE